MKHLPIAEEIEQTSFGAAELAALLHKLDERDASAGNRRDERRAWPRIRCRGFAIMTARAGAKAGVPIMIPLRNISRGGMAFLFDAALLPGTPCQFQIVQPDGDTIETSGQIVRCTPVGGGAFETGIQLDELIDIEFPED